MKIRMRLYIWLGLLLICQSCYFLKGGKDAGQPSTFIVDNKDKDADEISSYELRTKMNAYFIHFSGHIDEAADSIMMLSQSKEVRKRALLWKIHLIPAAQQAMLSHDPLGALIDASVLCDQMLIYFTEGNGRELFGEHQDIAIRASQNLISELDEMVKSIYGDRDMSGAVDKVHQFASNNPINSIYFNRKSTAPILARLKKEEKVGFKEMAMNATQSMESLSDRMNIYVEHIPEYVRWQSEYLISDYLYGLPLDTLSVMVGKRFNNMEGYMDRLMAVAEGVPYTVDRERQAITKDLQKERAIVLDALSKEREAILDRLSIERGVFMEELVEASQYNIEMTFDRMEDLMSKAFLWAFSILVCTVFFIAGLIFFYVKVVNSSSKT